MNQIDSISLLTALGDALGDALGLVVGDRVVGLIEGDCIEDIQHFV